MPSLHLKNCQKNPKHISAFSGEHKVSECVFFCFFSLAGSIVRLLTHKYLRCVSNVQKITLKLENKERGMKKGVNFGAFRDQYTTSAYILSRQLTFLFGITIHVILKWRLTSIFTGYILCAFVEGLF